MNLKGLLSALVIGAFVIGGCSEYNKTKVKDHNEGDERIYGDKGGPARQTLNK
jgi:PBP1b-binding outer membrane lipoprotein LpoB